MLKTKREAERLVDRVQGVRDRRDRLHARTDAQDGAGRHAALGPTGTVGRPDDLAVLAVQLVVRLGPAARGGREAVTDLDAPDKVEVTGRAERLQAPASKRSVFVRYRSIILTASVPILMFLALILWLIFHPPK